MLDTKVLTALFPSLLLALVARNTNIILSTSQPAELQKSTAKILSTVFGLHTKRVKVRTPQSPQDFLESLFLPAPPGSPSSHKRRSSRNSLPRSLSAPRPPSSHFTEGSDSTAPPAQGLHLPRYKTDPLPQYVEPQPSFRLPQVVIISGLERAGKAAQLALADAFRTHQITFDDTAAWDFPDGFFVVFVSHIGDGFERPNIHTTLLDHFAFSITLPELATPAVPMTPSPRLRPLPLTSQTRTTPLLPLDRLPSSDASYISPLISQYINALLTAARHHPELDGTLLTARCVKDAERLVRASGLVFRDNEHTMISEMHVRRVIPPILAHRLRVRNSPREHMMGILWEGAGIRNWGMPIEESQGRRMIKTILGEILAEV
ncbi:hypothetical protein K439DRAFT_1629435 [Ramaria rubella]|nr:hypothetical protein K439DRAFT_1629435 [Ramaria rubella]